MEIEESIKESFKFFQSKSLMPNMGNSLGIEFEKIAKSEVIASMPVDERTRQPMGLLHGGANVALAETIASVGGLFHLKKKNTVVVGLEINANHIRPAKSGRVLGIGKPVYVGSTTQVWEIKIKNEEDKLSCVSRCTLAVIPFKMEESE